jgi:hypothetical protein
MGKKSLQPKTDKKSALTSKNTLQTATWTLAQEWTEQTKRSKKFYWKCK